MKKPFFLEQNLFLNHLYNPFKQKINTILHGKDGKNGNDGIDGKDGLQKNGLPGKDGKDGLPA